MPGTLDKPGIPVSVWTSCFEMKPATSPVSPSPKVRLPGIFAIGNYRNAIKALRSKRPNLKLKFQTYRRVVLNLGSCFERNSQILVAERRKWRHITLVGDGLSDRRAGENRRIAGIQNRVATANAHGSGQRLSGPQADVIEFADVRLLERKTDGGRGNGHRE